MRADMVMPGEVSGLIEDPTFRILLWNRSGRARATWALDEWQIEDAPDVREVIEWAEAQNATTFEVLVRWRRDALNEYGHPVETFGYVRVAGEPGEDGSAAEVVTFTSIDELTD